MAQYLLADCETTGVGTTDKIVEVAWLLISDDFEVLDEGHSLINPQRPIPAGASAVHGITMRDVENAPTADEYFYDVLGNELGSVDAIFTAHNCVTGDHEVCTPGGWVRFDVLKDGQKVLQWDPETEEMTFTDCVILRSRYKGALLSWDTQFHKGVYTPNHRLVRKSSVTPNARWTFSTASELSRMGPNVSKIPVSGYYESPDPLPVSDAEGRVLEMIRADGNIQVSSSGAMSVRFKFKRPEKISRCCALLSAVGVGFSVSEGDRGSTVIRSKKGEVVQRLCTLLGSGREKSYGDWVLRLSLQTRTAILDELQHWDGSKSQGAGKQQVTVHSVNHTDVEWIREMAILSGFCAKVRLDKVNNRGFSREDGVISSVSVRPRKEVKTLERPEEVMFDGTVYCVTVPTGAFLVRRQGVTWVTGNSPFDMRYFGPYLPDATPQMCTLRLARKLYPNVDNHKLATLVYALELDVDKDRFHSADGDMIILMSLLGKMTEDHGYTLWDLFEMANTPIQMTTMTFGKHKGTPLKDLPQSYVTWLLKLDNLDPDLRASLAKHGFK
jgi:DNA polymerase III epsilon subunit-like protein